MNSAPCPPFPPPYVPAVLLTAAVICISAPSCLCRICACCLHACVQRQELEAEIPLLEGAVAAARSEHARVAEINATELTALRSQMAADLTAALREFVLIQVSDECMDWGSEMSADLTAACAARVCAYTGVRVGREGYVYMRVFTAWMDGCVVESMVRPVQVMLGGGGECMGKYEVAYSYWL